MGMHDILPEDSVYLQKIYSVAGEIAEFYQFQEIETPLLEDAELFAKGTGLTTDIVQKQMFVLRTKGGDLLTLRPEFTPSIARAYIEHGMFNLPQPVKLYSFGPVFRYEHPQAGRYRQFRQFNLEVLGEAGPIIDAQLIQLFYNILKDLKLKDIMVQINSIGDNQCRPYYKKILVGYFRNRQDALCSDCKRRMKENPLRVLDCKEEKCQRIVSAAPQIIDHLCEACHIHFKSVLEFLDEIEAPYQLNPYLVRGLDYYTKTVFEIVCQSGQENKAALAGGGRYDGLIKLLGGRDTPAAGGALGVERIVELMKAEQAQPKRISAPQVFLSQLGVSAKRKSLKLMEDFRKENIRLAESLGRDSLKVQLRTADKIGARFTLILGQAEVLEGNIIVRDMETGRQDKIKIDKIVETMKERLKR